jgi:hypothetical protein
MTAGTDPTVVIFRKWPAREGGGIIALFPYESASVVNPYVCQSYEHVGQHGAADCQGVISRTRPASPDEYAALMRELESAPYHYVFDVRKRTPRDATSVLVEAARKRRERGTT